VRVLRFSFFSELKRLLTSELENGYDAVIHSAAVSDFAPVNSAKGKIPSGRQLKLTLKPTPKLVDLIRRKAPQALLVAFKYLPGSATGPLIKAGRELGKRSGANMVVANTVRQGAYRAFVIAPQGIVPEAGSKEELAALLKLYLEAFFRYTPRAAKCSCAHCR
jgi:hypothetical protein